MPSEPACPDEKSLESALLGLATAAESDLIEAHLSQCPKCLEQSRNLAAEDTWVEMLRRQQHPPEDMELPQYAGPLMERLKELPDSEKTFVSAVNAELVNESVPPSGPTRDLLELASPLATTTSIPAVITPNQVLGNYVLLEKIGAGGMGQVFKARHRRMDRIVALKVLPSKFMQDQAAVARFEREVKAAARISHRNIVAAYDADQSHDVHFLVMEYVEGSDLSALVKKSGPMPVGQAVDCILQAAMGLEAAHAEGIVHRDIKPANLLLDKKGVVKILDMGLARIHDDTVAQAELTATGAVMGTVDYMAPEQALDTKSADARADIYSLGCTLFYLLTGRAAYQGETLTARLLAHQGQVIPELRSFRADVNERLEFVFRKMVAKKVGDRYQSMSALIADLERVNEDMTSTNSPVLTSAVQAPVTASTNATSLEQSAVVPPARVAMPRQMPADDSNNRRLWKRLAICCGGAAVLALMAAVVIQVKTKSGTLIVTVSEPGASVQVLDDRGVVVTTGDDKQGAITISVVPGMRRLRVEKAGFEVFTSDEMEVRSGTNKTITVKLQPLAAISKDPGAPAIQPASSVAASAPHPSSSTPEFQRWMKDVAVLSAEMQAEAVIKKLRELNPGFEMEVKYQVSQGVVRELNISTVKVLDVSPIQVLTGLETLNCGGPGGGTEFADLSPVKGMKLKKLFCGYSKVADLSPLQGMPLTELNIIQSHVADLSPLRGMPLKRLSLRGTQVADLSPLQGMMLESLDCGVCRVWNLAPLHGMPLTDLQFDHTQVTDLWPLEGMPLTTIGLAHSPVADLSSLRGMQLPALHCGGTAVFDLSPLEGMPLKKLQCAHTAVSDLSPLKGMRLTELDIANTRVANLAPLKGMPLTTLECSDTAVSDLSPLDGMNLTALGFTPSNIVRGIEGVRQMTGLKSIAAGQRQEDRVARKEFWTKFDAGAYLSEPMALARSGDDDFQQWKKQVEGLPAEQQVQAVTKKLRELNPEFDGSENHRIEFDVVVEFHILPNRVTDISPIRVFAGLEVFSLRGSGGGWLTDLSPLKGMRLTSLTCSGVRVCDLGPLQGMPLRFLDCSNSSVADLSPLNGMPLTNLLCSKTKIDDLSPLQGMHLTQLDCNETLVSDLSPLKGVPLSDLKIKLTLISNLSALAEMKLKSLDCGKTPITDLSPLKGMPLTELWIENTRVTDLSPLLGMDLERLWLSPRNIIRGMDVVRQLRSIETIGTHVLPQNHFPAEQFWKKLDAGEFGKPHSQPTLTTIEAWKQHVATLPAEKQVEAVVRKLQELNPHFNGNATHRIDNGIVTELGIVTDEVTDISPVQALQKLKKLNCAGSNAGRHRLSDLSPVQGLALTDLDCSWSQVSDLSALRGMPLTNLTCTSTLVADLSALIGLPLRGLNLYGSKKLSDLSPLRGMKLSYLNLTQCPLVAEITPLRGMPLDSIEFAGTQVSDLSPLEGMALSHLNIGNTKVSDLIPLKGMPILELKFDGTLVSDLSSLEGMKLTVLLFTPHRISKGLDIVRQMKTLDKIGLGWDPTLQQDKGHFAPDEFWKKYDNGELN